MATARNWGQARDERWHCRKDGSRFWANGVMETLHYPAGPLRGFAKILRDNTAQKEAADALYESQQRYRQALDAAQLGTWRYDIPTDTNYFDERSQAIFGLERATYSADEIDTLIHPEDLDNFLQARAAALDPSGSGAFHHAHRIVHPDGTVRWIRANCQVFFSGVGSARRPIHAVGVIADVTERREALLALRRLNETLEEQVAERTEQVRELVTELAMSEQAERHRISQILHEDLQQRLYGFQFQLTFARALLNDMRSEVAEWASDRGKHSDTRQGTAVEPSTYDRLISIIDDINEEITGAIGLTRSLSIDLSPPVLQGEGLVEALGWLAGQMQQRHGLTIHLRVAEQLPVPNADLRVLLFQAVREALFNVVKHTGVNEATVKLRHSGETLRIEIIDEGHGFDVDKVFQGPQESQGLWQNKRRLELVGGEMVIESSSATGTRVILTCPIPDTA